MEKPPTDEDFRKVGFTGEARIRPRAALALVMFAAWNNVRVDQLPEAMRYHPNESTMQAWNRVGEAALEYLRLRDAA